MTAPKSASDVESPRERTAAFLLALVLHLAVLWWIFSSLRLSQPAQVPAPLPLEVTLLPPPPVEKPRFVEVPASARAARPPDPQNAFESNADSLAASELAPQGSAPLPTTQGEDSPALELENRPASVSKPENPTPPEEAVPEKSQSPRKTGDLAIARPSPTPRPSATPRPPGASATQRETRVTRLRGNVSNRGRSSVEAVSTPLGRYKKQVSDAIGSRWYYYVQSQMGLLSIGTVDIRFTVAPDGKVKSPVVLSNSSNESFASVSLAAIVQAEIPPIPPDVARILENGRLEIDFSFTILGN